MKSSGSRERDRPASSPSTFSASLVRCTCADQATSLQIGFPVRLAVGSAATGTVGWSCAGTGCRSTSGEVGGNSRLDRRCGTHLAWIRLSISDWRRLTKPRFCINRFRSSRNPSAEQGSDPFERMSAICCRAAAHLLAFSSLVSVSTPHSKGRRVSLFWKGNIHPEIHPVKLGKNPLTAGLGGR